MRNILIATMILVSCATPTLTLVGVDEHANPDVIWVTRRAETGNVGLFACYRSPATAKDRSPTCFLAHYIWQSEDLSWPASPAPSVDETGHRVLNEPALDGGGGGGAAPTSNVPDSAGAGAMGAGVSGGAGFGAPMYKGGQVPMYNGGGQIEPMPVGPAPANGG